jgi:hypothetical protein
VLTRPRARSTIKIRSKKSLYPHGHFTEQLVDAFRKPPRESNLNHETSESFYPTTQELYRDKFLQQSIQSNQGKWMNRCIPIAKTTQQNQRTKLMPDLVTTQENLHLTRTQHRATESGWSCNTGKLNQGHTAHARGVKWSRENLSGARHSWARTGRHTANLHGNEQEKRENAVREQKGGSPRKILAERTARGNGSWSMRRCEHTRAGELRRKIKTAGENRS